MTKQNTINIRQPYEGDRGSLLISIDASNLPAPAYAALEDVFASAEEWANRWLPNTVAPDGSRRHWWDQDIKSSSMPTRAKNALSNRNLTGDPLDTVKDIFDFCDDGNGEVDFDHLMTLPRFGPETLESLTRWLERQASKNGTSLNESIAASSEL